MFGGWREDFQDTSVENVEWERTNRNPNGQLPVAYSSGQVTRLDVNLKVIITEVVFSAMEHMRSLWE